MLSYRHAFHAGNYADVLKHLVQAEILAYMGQKEKGFDYIDTHAGAGIYDLTGDYANKTKEYEAGIARLLSSEQASSKLFVRYTELVNKLNLADSLKLYPGSPKIAQSFIRAQDKAWLFELHPSDFKLLQQNFARIKQFKVQQTDGYAGLLALLPTASRRALVMIDPPYELKSDYQQVADTVAKALAKMANAVVAIWYPVVTRDRIDQLLAQLINAGLTRIDQYELGVDADTEGYGMTSAGMIVINPPWQLRQHMQQCLPYLATLFSNDGQPHYQVNEIVGE